jgi:Zn-dependent protease
MPDGLALGLSALALIQVLAFVLNILPVPGLDGFGVLEPFLSYSPGGGRPVRPWAPIALFVLILGVPGWHRRCSGSRAGVLRHRRRHRPGVHRLQRAVLLAAVTIVVSVGSSLGSASAATSAGRPIRR